MQTESELMLALREIILNFDDDFEQTTKWGEPILKKIPYKKRYFSVLRIAARAIGCHGGYGKEYLKKMDERDAP